MIKAVIFDFDGVLCDTFDIGFSIFRAQFEDLDVETFKRHHDGNVFESSAVDLSKVDDSFYFEKYFENVHVENFFPVFDQIKRLSKKYKLFIVSSNHERSLDKYLSLADIKANFQAVLGMETEKSKVKKLNMILDELGVKPKECVFVTDTLGDILEGKKSGIRTLAVAWGYHERERLEKGNPDLIIDEFDHLERAIEQFI